MRRARTTPLTVSACVLCVLACAAGRSPEMPASDVLALCRAQSEWTDPGAHVAMYSNLPHSPRRLCELIKCQLIHPFDLHRFEAQVGENWRFEDLDFATVTSMLDGFAQRGQPELSLARSPKDRLVVACWHHGLLLASMLRYHGVPVRLRAGFARYIGQGSGLHVGHVICEVWDEEHSRWSLVDPDREKVDFSRREFELASEAWESLRNGSEVGGYRSAHYKGPAAIVHLLSVDMRSVLCDEVPYWHNSEIVQASAESLGALDSAEIALLDRVASCLRTADTSLQELRALRSSSESLREVDRSEEFSEHLPQE